MASHPFNRQCLALLLLVSAGQLLAGHARADQIDAGSTRELYGAECRKQVGDIPEFSCSDGVPVPITVDGKSVPATKNMTCDRPALLPNGAESDGQCVPNSRILSLSTKTMQIAVMCRQKIIRPADKMEFDEIDIVAHNPKTGATCWFQAEGKPNQPVSGEKVPSPTSQPSNEFWNTPETTLSNGCGTCHDNDPFMFSPFVGQVWNHMPVNPFGPYYHVDLPSPHRIGFSSWPTQALNPTDNTCLGCHRIGIAETCRQLTDEMTGRFPEGADDWARRFPGSHAMPPDIGITQTSWNAIYKSSVDQIRSCCQKPDQKACHVTAIPAYPPPN
ncbi:MULTISPECIES: hypothetical protein [unclassified Rhizobium]|uniref:hypothetical protein n=1 Tax=unclassified Rhizobium TaxID=2613769 RepID=UPI000EA84880|nr:MULTISPECIES: hypothetical protein [unclassified Rhizobium]AYG69318.1 hypothetical protein CCGE531_25135 [Rhizobium sp. CCGE531]AYG75697.1 hypothetical protein CCGE532_24640 [Rhizobium sp. CCGE532]